MTPRERSALNETEIALREVLHAVRDPLIDRGARLIAAGLRKQRQAFIAHGLKALSLTEADVTQQHQIEGALMAIPPLDQSISGPSYNRLVVKTFVNGANQSGALIDQTYGENTDFVKEYIAEHALEMIGKDIDETTVSQMRNLLTAGVDADTPLSKIITQIKQAGAFSRQRAETIAVTEIGNAYSQGTLDAAQQMSDDGANMEKSWLAEGDCCDICDGNADDDWIPIDDNFSSGDDAPLAHPNCRCALLTRVAEEES